MIPLPFNETRVKEHESQSNVISKIDQRKKSIYISVHRKQEKETANSLTFCELVMTLNFEKRRPTHPN